MNKSIVIPIISLIGLVTTINCLADTLTGALSTEDSGTNNNQFLEGKVNQFHTSISKEINSAEITQEDLERIAGKDLILLIDKSASMNSYCPSPVSGDGLTKFFKHAASLSLNIAVPETIISASPCSEWQWVVKQIKTLSSLTTPIYHQGITVVFFDCGRPQVYQNVNIQNLNRVLAFKSPGGGTDIFPPLRDQIAAYFQRRFITGGQAKPILIVLITDGLVCGGKHLQKILVNATNNMKYADEITICIMQVGIMPMGKKAMMKLDNKLMAAGAKYHIVHTLPYKDLQKIGLTKAIANALTENLN